MSAKKYKGVLIVGKDTADNQIQRSNILTKAYEKEGFKVIGSAEKGFELSDLKTLDGMIDNNTIIVITAHGSSHNERHVIQTSDKIIYTGDLLEILNLYGNGSPLNLILSSCHGGLASKDSSILSRGSVFITPGLENQPIDLDLTSHSLEQQLLKCNSYHSLFEWFINEFLKHSIQTSMISVSQGANNKPITFKVHPSLQDVIESPEKTLTKIQTDLLEFYSSLHIKSNNFEVRELTAQEISEFQKGYFIYNCFIGNTAIVELLNSNIEPLELSNLVNSKLADKIPLTAAAQEGHLEIVKALLQHNEDIDKAANYGTTPLFMAAQNGHLEIVKELLHHNADVDKAENNGVTPLLMAAHKGDLEIVKILLHHNANVDKARNDGTTPLFMAAQEGHLEIVKELLHHNADVDKAANDGTTPLFMAAQEGHLEIVEILLQHNADVDKAINNGATPILLAICFKNDAIAKELISHSNKIWNHQSNESKANIKSIEKYCPSELDHYYNLVEEAKSHHHEEL